MHIRLAKTCSDKFHYKNGVCNQMNTLDVSSKLFEIKLHLIFKEEFLNMHPKKTDLVSDQTKYSI